MIGALLGDLWPYLIAAVTAIAGALGLYFKGRADAKAKRKADELKQEVKAHERINKADTGAGLDDDQRIDRLREFATKHGTRSPQAGHR
jgi:hypothetical protein